MGAARSSDDHALICFSRGRWDFVYQRAQQLMVRAVRGRRVFFVEEPVFDRGPAHLTLRRSVEGVLIAVPTLPRDTPPGEVDGLLRELVDHLIEHFEITRYVLWFSTPAALPFTHHLAPCGVVYDCLDDQPGFRAGRPTQLELRLLGAADVVFTEGRSLCDAKREHHANVHAFASPIDVDHFLQGRGIQPEPADTRALLGAKVGFAGAVDERLDLALVAAVADLRPHLSFVMVGPIARAVAADLPRRPNLHWLGARTYAELPRYLASWQAAMLPLRRDDDTALRSPTATLEYLTAGRAVVSTSIADIVHPYRDLGLVRIADDAAGFAAALDAAIAEDGLGRIRHVDRWLATQSWDRTWDDMDELIDQAIETRAATFTELAARPRPRRATPDAALAISI